MSDNFKPMAITHLTRQQLEAKLRIAFSDSEDVLGRMQIGTPVNSNPKYTIRIYESSPKPSTEILMNPDNAKAELTKLLEVLDTNRDDLFWIHPRAGGSLRRRVVDVLHENLERKNSLIQIVVGPRQVGKTTAVHHLIKEWPDSTHYISADSIIEEYIPWLEKHWQYALSKGDNTLLVIDEIQKIENWTELVKKLWDKTKNRGIKVVVLGSTSLAHSLVRPISESLAGRFNPIYVPHWSYLETKEVFSTTLDDYTIFGGYPKAMEYSDDHFSWHEYIGSSIINPIIDVDIFQQGKFKDIAKLRRAFRVFCQEVDADCSYTSLLKKIQSTGNTDIIRRYLNGYADSFLLTQLPSIDNKGIPDPRKHPRILLNCPAVYTFGRNSETPKDGDPIRFKQTIGAELAKIPHTTFGYWQEGDTVEMDFFIQTEDRQIFGINIEGEQRIRSTAKSFDRFRSKFKKARIATISVENADEFLMGQRAYLESAAI